MPARETGARLRNLPAHRTNRFETPGVSQPTRTDVGPARFFLLPAFGNQPPNCESFSAGAGREFCTWITSKVMAGLLFERS